MYARVTLLEIDTVRMDMAAAVDMYEAEVLPELKEQPGYQGVLVLTTPEGKGAVVSLWDSEANAEAGGQSGFYPEILERYMTLFRSAPGRDRYEVAFAELPATIAT